MSTDLFVLGGILAVLILVVAVGQMSRTPIEAMVRSTSRVPVARGTAGSPQAFLGEPADAVRRDGVGCMSSGLDPTVIAGFGTTASRSTVAIGVRSTGSPGPAPTLAPVGTWPATRGRANGR